MGLKSFVEGGIAAVVAGCSTHPLDLIKVRMQLQGEAKATATATATAGGATQRLAGPLEMGMRIVRAEGPAGLFAGVSATVLRQGLYSTTRMGLYENFKAKWTDDRGSFPFIRKVTAGLISGGIGAAIGNPADIAMVRMQADGRLPLEQRRRYQGVSDAIRRMVQAEGLGTLWRGSSLTVNRAMIVTAAQLATYDQAKEAILATTRMGDGLATHVAASLMAGLAAAVASNPVDVIKTRVMNMKGVAYAGAVDCAVRTVRVEGVLALYKGFVPTVARQGPFTVVLFVTLEQVRKLLKDF